MGVIGGDVGQRAAGLGRGEADCWGREQVEYLGAAACEKDETRGERREARCWGVGVLS